MGVDIATRGRNARCLRDKGIDNLHGFLLSAQFIAQIHHTDRSRSEGTPLQREHVCLAARCRIIMNNPPFKYFGFD
jgi:hypothetical protein